MLFFFYSTHAQVCGNTWLNVKDEITGVQLGDLDVTGNKLTIEAKVTRTLLFDPSFKGGDIVSKHENPTDANYLLRANGAEITTTNGFFATPQVCNIELNKTYHVAMVYDGSKLKFYRNGYLLSQVSCTGNMITNDWSTAIGTTAYLPSPYPADFLGYIDEVRIWKTARTQDELRQYMNQSLPSPTSQNGLLAYYTFDNLKNKQGNVAWNGSLLGSASIKNNNPTCQNFIVDSCEQIVTTPTTVIADFSVPDTVCANTPVTINNITTGGTNFYWNFCVADINQITVGSNLGNLGNQLSMPVFMDLAQDDNGDYYGFSINHIPGQLIRYNFGNSYLNNPIVENLGNYGGAIPNQAEGVQVIKANGQWYIIVVGGGNNLTNSSPRIVTINFGASLGSTNQTANNWGDIGMLSQPIDLHVFNEADHWYGLTVNATNNTITRFDFSNDLNNAPTATNLGDFGLLNYPDGIYAINDNGFWRVFVTNGVGNTLTRLDFGSSLLNNPTAVDLANPGNTLITPRDMLAIKFCGSNAGFIVNAATDEIIKLDFGTGFDQMPTAVSLGNIANLDKPHSLSKLFRVEQDIYSFITSVDNNTITRIKFSGCNSSSIPNSSDSIPVPISYNTPGLYNIHLMVDEGLPTQASICKSITVVASPVKTPIFDTAFCAGDSLKLTTTFPAGSYAWSNGEANSSIIVNTPGTYWVESNYYGCVVRDSINTLQNVLPVVHLGADTSICNADSLLLNAGNIGSAYLWQDGSTAQTFNTSSSGTYSVQVTDVNGCVATDSIQVDLYGSMQLQLTKDTTICAGNNITLSASGNNIQSYSWSPSATLPDPSAHNPIVSPVDTTLYVVEVTDIHGCKDRDSVWINVAPQPAVTSIPDTSICIGDNIILSTIATPGVSYSWSPSSGLSDYNSDAPLSSPLANTQYIVSVATSAGCKASDTVAISINPLPALAAGTMDSLICIDKTALLEAISPTAVAYEWFPAAGLNDAFIATPVATPNATTNYRVEAKDINGCKAFDSVLVSVKQKPVFAVDPPTAGICTGESVILTASGGDEYAWYPPNGLSDANSAVTVASPTSTTTYKAVITDNICAVTDSIFTTVNLRALSSIDITKTNDIDCITGTTNLKATGGVIYHWSPSASLSDSAIANPVATPLEATTYYVQVTNATGCTGTDSITVYVYKGSVENGYKLPSAFTPNNDGYNDCFGVRRWGALSNLSFDIYNRWGSLIFHTNNSADCWDGTYKGVPQVPGTYVYQVKAQALCGTVYRKGTIVLVR